MRAVTTVVVVLSWVVITVSTPYGEDCDFTDLDLDDALTTVITELSQYRGNRDTIESYLRLVKINCCNVSGVESLRQYGPLLPYCVNGTRKLQVDLVNDRLLEVAMKWLTYTGTQGTLVVGARLARLTVQLQVVQEPSGSRFVLKLEEPIVLVESENTYADVYDAGEIAGAATALWSRLLPSVTQNVWKYYFLDHLRSAIHHTRRGSIDMGVKTALEPSPDEFIPNVWTVYADEP